MRPVLLTIGGGAVFKHAKTVRLDELSYGDQAAALEQHRHDGVVFFHGGADVMPQLYGEYNRYSGTHPARDVAYLWVWQLRKTLGLPFMAVCGGHQFVTAVNGGTLFQDLHADNGNQHPGEHYVTLTDAAPDWLVDAMNAYTSRIVDVADRTYKVNSTHHQATRGVPPNAKVVARAYDGVVEALLYEDGFTCQWHPEFYNHDALFNAVRERF